MTLFPLWFVLVYRCSALGTPRPDAFHRVMLAEEGSRFQRESLAARLGPVKLHHEVAGPVAGKPSGRPLLECPCQGQICHLGCEGMEDNP